jgi:class 3 adenylate cyclase
MEQNSMSRSHSLSDSGPRLTDSHHQPLLTRLSEAASALREQQVLLQQQESQQPRASTSSHGRRSSTAAADGDRLSSLKGDSEVPVVYKQWHPAVSVLFADISGYTALSTQVEPEQVRCGCLDVTL